MRRLLALAAVAGITWRLLGRRRRAAGARATIGYADGSSLTLAPGAPELERLRQVAEEVVGA
jgi:hypothetical protein